MSSPKQSSSKQIPEIPQQNHLTYIGLLIKEYRLSINLSQQEAAKDIGISRNTLQKVEYGHNFSLMTLFKICDSALDIRLVDLFIDIE